MGVHVGYYVRTDDEEGEREILSFFTESPIRMEAGDIVWLGVDNHSAKRIANASLPLTKHIVEDVHYEVRYQFGNLIEGIEVYVMKVPD